MEKDTNKVCEKTGKLRYDSKFESEISLANIQMLDKLKYSNHHYESRVYDCPFCNGWHLTSLKKKG